MKQTLIAIALLAAVTGCGKSQEKTIAATTPVTSASAGTANASPAPATAEVTQNSGAPAPSAQQLSGTVTETTNSGGYTYVKVKTASGEQWAAIPQSTVKKGAAVTIDAQMTMQNFESKSLNKTFDTIVFGTLAAPGGPGAMPPAMASQQLPAGHPATGAAPASPMGGPAQHMAAPDAGAIQVAKAEGPDAKTVSEVWAAKSSLSGKPIVVRGKVVKSLSGIMGRNWLHVRDGSGSSEKGDNDLTVTSSDSAKVGDIVVVSGVVHIDKDFGAGYRYAVIVEDAKLQK